MEEKAVKRATDGGSKGEVLTDKINYAMLDLALVIPFSIGFIRILIRFFLLLFVHLESVLCQNLHSKGFSIVLLFSGNACC